MILARCPHCETTFRAAPEALKLRAGKVRCGKCQQVFNALDHLVHELPPASAALPASGFALTPPASPPLSTRPIANQSPRPESPPDGLPVSDDSSVIAQPEEIAPAARETHETFAALPTAAAEQILPAAKPIAEPTTESTTKQPDEATAQDASEVDVVAYSGDLAAPAARTSPPPNDAPPADPLFEAQAAGLMAARDTRDVPGYSKWAEGTLSAPAAPFDEPHKTGWLAVVLIVILALMMLTQATYQWRTEIAKRWPDARPWLEEACHSANCTVPYARDAGQINLEASELQIDPTRGDMLVLNMTLKNRAPFAQEFPSVELTLTDARDNVVVRRILGPNEWLPTHLDATASPAGTNPVSTPAAFPGNKEIAARLWIDAKDTGAVGYRLFVLYP